MAGIGFRKAMRAAAARKVARTARAVARAKKAATAAKAARASMYKAAVLGRVAKKHAAVARVLASR